MSSSDSDDIGEERVLEFLPAGSSASKAMASKGVGLLSSTKIYNSSSSPMTTSDLEQQLKQQANSLIQQRHQEIDGYKEQLEQALAEVARVRVAEEAHLAARVTEAQLAFSSRVEELQKQFQQQVKDLETQTQTYVEQLRAESEAAMLNRIRQVSGALGLQTPTSSPAALRGAPRPLPSQRPLPAFLTPQGPGSRGLTAGSLSQPSSARAAAGGSSQRSLFSSQAASLGLPMKGSHIGALHKVEPGVLDILAGDDD